MGKDTNKIMLIIVKLVVTVFNMPSTWYVFYELFVNTNRPNELAVFNTFMAILAIDAVFLWILQGLEDSKLEPIKRLPYAITAVLLAVLIVLIGIMDEGSVLAFAPRIGMIVLVFNDLLSWATDGYERYFSREQIEQRIRNKEVIKRQKVKSEAYKRALDRLSENFEENVYVTELGKLGVEENVPERSGTPEELPENIFMTDSGTYGWLNERDELIIKNKQEKMYKTSRGALIARSRHMKDINNGRN